MRLFWLRRSLFWLRSTSGEGATVRAGVFIRTEVAYMPKMLFHPCFQLFNLTDDSRLDLVRGEVLFVLGWVASNFLLSRSGQGLHRVDLCLVCSESTLREVCYRAGHFHSVNTRSFTKSCQVHWVKILLTFVGMLHLFNLRTLWA
jgi:hypothetical protein